MKHSILELQENDKSALSPVFLRKQDFVVNLVGATKQEERIIDYDSREFWELAFATHEYVFLPYRDIITTASTQVQFSKMTTWNIFVVELNDWFLISIPIASSPFTSPPSRMIGTHEESKCAQEESSNAQTYV